MKSFRDAEGRDWPVTVDINVVKRVRSLVGLNILDIDGGELFNKLSDPITLCDVLYVVCKPTADERGVTDEDFGRGLRGDAIDNATVALLDELVDFFPREKGEFLRLLLERSNQTRERLRGTMTTRLNDPEFAQKVDALILGAASGKPQESSESTLAR